MPTLPFKLNQDRRRHIPRQQPKVANWPAYDASLRQRGSLTVWAVFPVSARLRMVEELLAARGILVSHETVRQWARKFGQAFANQIRRRLPSAGDKWHLDEVVLTIAGVKHGLWRAVDQTGIVLDVLVQSRRDQRAANACCVSCSSASTGRLGC